MNYETRVTCPYIIICIKSTQSVYTESQSITTTNTHLQPIAHRTNKRPFPIFLKQQESNYGVHFVHSWATRIGTTKLLNILRHLFVVYMVSFCMWVISVSFFFPSSPLGILWRSLSSSWCQRNWKYWWCRSSTILCTIQVTCRGLEEYLDSCRSAYHQ